MRINSSRYPTEVSVAETCRETSGPIDGHLFDRALGQASPSQIANARLVIVALRRGRDQSRRVVLMNNAIRHLNWWNNSSNLFRGLAFQPPLQQLTVITDASLQGWGIVFRDKTFRGVWNRSSQHINCLELRVVLSALQLLQFHVRDKSVFFIDNATAVAYLNKQGDTHSRALLKLSISI